MHYTVECLVTGKRNISDYYHAAVGRWNEIWARPESGDILGLATMLSDEEPWFEEHCGGRWLGQEVMAVSGIGMLYSLQAGFEDRMDRAQRLYSAFLQSGCSLEVKRMAREAAESYRLLDLVM